METKKSKLELYEFRAAWLSSGPLVRKLLAQTFKPVVINEKIIEDAHANSFIEDIADTNVSFVIIPFDIGFPPDEAVEQFDYFRKISDSLLDEGIETLALITASSYVAEGEYARAPWEARMPKGKPVFYDRATNRKMACLANGQWRKRVQDMAVIAMEANAGGVFLDALCFGAAPVFMNGALDGPAGCHCEECKKQFDHIPVKLKLPDDAASRRFVDWRAGVVSEFVAGVDRKIKKIEDEALLAVGLAMAGALPVLPMFGIDVPWMLNNADIVCVDHSKTASISKEGLKYEAPLFNIAVATAPETGGALVSGIGTPAGPAQDVVIPHSHYAALLAAGFSAGAAPVFRFGEYRGAEKEETVAGEYLAGNENEKPREALAVQFNRLEKNYDVYEQAVPVSRTAIAYSWDLMSYHPGSIFQQAFFTILQTLTEVQIPLCVLAVENAGNGEKNETLDHVKVLIVPEGGTEADAFRPLISRLGEDVRLLFVGNVPGWADAERSAVIDPAILAPAEVKKFLRGAPAKWVAKKAYAGEPGIYGGFPLSRRAGIPPPGLSDFRQAFCRYQPTERWEELRDLVTDQLSQFPEDVTIEAPPYIHVREWKKGSETFFHVVNILPGFPGPDHAVLHFSQPVDVRIIHTESNRIIYNKSESKISVKPAPYAIINVKNRNGS